MEKASVAMNDRLIPWLVGIAIEAMLLAGFLHTVSRTTAAG
jgi:hypothetical protein